jgi:hypothetical protein
MSRRLYCRAGLSPFSAARVYVCHRAHYISTQVYRSQLVPFILYVRVTIIDIVAVAVDTVAVVVSVVTAVVAGVMAAVVVVVTVPPSPPLLLSPSLPPSPSLSLPAWVWTREYG